MENVSAKTMSPKRWLQGGRHANDYVISAIYGSAIAHQVACRQIYFPMLRVDIFAFLAARVKMSTLGSSAGLMMKIVSTSFLSAT